MTLIELAIAILMAGVILSASFSLYLNQHKMYNVQEEINDMQSSLRVATAELATKIRLAGYDFPEAIIELPAIQAYDTNPDTILLAYASHDFGDVKTEQDMPDPSAALQCDGHDLSNLMENESVYIADPVILTGEYLLATTIDYSNSIIRHNTAALTHSYPAGSRIIKIVKFKYYIDKSDSTHPNLMRQMNSEAPQILAENITDLQFKYLLTSSDVVDAPMYSKLIREVLISMTARTEKPDPDFQNQYRNRTLLTKAKVRNLGNL